MVAEVVEYVTIQKSSVPFCDHRAVLRSGLLQSDMKASYNLLVQGGKEKGSKTGTLPPGRGPISSRRKLRDRRNMGCKQELSPRKDSNIMQT